MYINARSVVSRPTALLLCVCAVLDSSALAEDWPSWRGAGTASTDRSDYKIEWDLASDVLWKAELPGPGNSSPIVVGNKVFITQYVPEDQSRQLRCYAAETGTLLWQASETTEEQEPTHPTNPYCASSPVADDQHVVAFFGSAGLCCYDHDGNLLWKRTLGSPQHLFGQGASPMIFEEIVVLNYGPGTEQFWVACDLASGRELWRLPISKVDAPNPFDQPGGPKLPEGTKLRDPFGTWATPLVVKHGEQTQLILAFPKELRSVDPASGETLWYCDESLSNQVFCTPVPFIPAVAAEQTPTTVICMGGTALAVRIDGLGDVAESHRLWFQEEDRGRIGTGVIVGENMIANTMQGIIESIDVATGERNWQQRLTSGSNSAGSWSSLARAGDRIYAPSKDGTVFVFSVDPEYKLLASNTLEETMNSSLAFSNGRIFVRTDKHLWCIH